MKKMKKIAFGTFAALSTVAIPVVSVVSCGDSETPTFDIKDEGGHGKYEAWVKKHVNKEKGTIDADVNLKFGDKIAHLKKGDTKEEIGTKMKAIMPK